MAIAPNFPAIRHSLLLDFANSKVLDPRITFGRASAATYYDGKTVAKAEENLLVRSQEFDAASWNKTRISVAANATTAPDGTVTADFISQVAGQTDSGVVDQLPTMPNDVVTFSIYAKAEAKTFIVLRLAGLNTWFNLSAGVVATVGLGVTAAIAPVGNGWYRCVVSKNAFGFNQAAVRPADSDNSVTVTDSGGIYIWGAQLEQRSQVTAYTPTTTQPITNYVPVLQTAAANVARFDHNPVTGESLGLLIEEQRTNLLTYSEQFSGAAWSKPNSTVQANVAVAPDGTLSADKFVETTTSLVLHGLSESTNNAAGTYTATVYAKSAGRTKFRLSSNSGQNPAAEFDLSSGTATPIGTTSSASITSVGNGWYRCSATRTITGGADEYQLQLMVDAQTAYTGDGYSGIYIWGAQLEAGDKATSYIKTEASQVTRAADPNLVAALGQAGPGTIYMDATVRSGNTLATSGATTFAATASARQKTAVAYDAASTRKSINGAAVTSSAGTQGGSSISIAPGATGWINKLAIYPQKASDAQLQALTA